jgi:hypothetical protein
MSTQFRNSGWTAVGWAMAMETFTELHMTLQGPNPGSCIFVRLISYI